MSFRISNIAIFIFIVAGSFLVSGGFVFAASPQYACNTTEYTSCAKTTILSSINQCSASNIASACALNPSSGTFFQTNCVDCSVAGSEFGCYPFITPPICKDITKPSVTVDYTQNSEDTVTITSAAFDSGSGMGEITVFIDLNRNDFFADPGETKKCFNVNSCSFPINGLSAGQSYQYYATAKDKSDNGSNTLPVKTFTVQAQGIGFTVGPIKKKSVTEGVATNFTADVVVAGSFDVVSCVLVVDTATAGSMVNQSAGGAFFSSAGGQCSPCSTCIAKYATGYTFIAGSAGQHTVSARCADSNSNIDEDPTTVMVQEAAVCDPSPFDPVFGVGCDDSPGGCCNGTSCVDDESCFSGFCDSICKNPLKANGEACSSGNECQSGVCSSNICSAPPLGFAPEVDFLCSFAGDGVTATFIPKWNGGGSPVYYGWKFGDGASLPNAPMTNPPNPDPVTHRYEHSDRYTVTLTAIDIAGRSGQASHVCDSLFEDNTPNPSLSVFKNLLPPLVITNISDLLNTFITFILFIATPILALLIIYSGVTLMVSGSSPQNKLNAMRILQYGIIGYGIILLSKVLLGVITGILF